jgi:hypothetical protein
MKIKIKKRPQGRLNLLIVQNVDVNILTPKIPHNPKWVAGT